MKQEPRYVVLAQHLEPGEGSSVRYVDLVEIAPEQPAGLESWEPVVGQPIPREIRIIYDGDNHDDYNKILVIPNNEELQFLRALQSFDASVVGGTESLVTLFGDLCAKVIDGYLSDHASAE